MHLQKDKGIVVGGINICSPLILFTYSFGSNEKYEIHVFHLGNQKINEKYRAQKTLKEEYRNCLVRKIY